MGKNRHSKDRLFVTQTEHKYLYGGKKTEIRRAYRRLPFNCCAITLSPFSNPVCTREGHLFDLEAVVPYVQQHQINPVTGKPLALKELIKLKFGKNSQGELFCPVTYKVFTDNSKIAAIATTGNVFAYEAIEELNIKPKNWTIESFEHFRRAKELDQKAQPEGVVKNIRTNAATDRILQELEAKRAEKKELVEKIKRGDDSVSEKDKIVASLTHTKPSKQELEAAAARAKAAAAEAGSVGGAKLQYSQFTEGDVSRSFTSSAMTPMTINLAAIASESEMLEARWHTVRRMKKKGLVRLVTTLGPINVEIDCDFVPQTADNFMSLCAAQYYDGVLFHRVVQGFMMQGGDPTGTGRGGESVWKKPFRDEIDSRLSHNARGVLSMANSGPGTNRSQFFITFKACTHLDKKHAVFGRVVGGMEVLDKVEQLSTDSEDRPYDDVKILRTEVYANPFQEYDAAKAQGKDVFEVAKEKAASEASAKVRGVVLKVGNEWVAYDDLGDGAIAQIPTSECSKDESVGKYLKAGAVTSKAVKKRSLEDDDTAAGAAAVAMTIPSAIEGKKSKQTKTTGGGFGNFAGW
ncbi:hypothetical protein PybrP1_003225 [[Pythium] brassicae (nom. inval.)]|nr:hypothetical protein PybrP1_003225 [[Pythium] brassicae (nom. inval.)]